jgi:hypothetical protein
MSPNRKYLTVLIALAFSTPVLAETYVTAPQEPIVLAKKVTKKAKKKVAPTKNTTSTPNTIAPQDAAETSTPPEKAVEIQSPPPAAPEPSVTTDNVAPSPRLGLANFFQGNGSIITSEVRVSAGVRHDNLDWNTGSNRPGSDILSELEWKLDMAEIRLDGNWINDKGIVFNAEASYARATSGDNRDSDYELTRSREFSRSKSDADGSKATRFSLGIGGRFVPNPNLAITPLLGYAWQNLDLRMKDGVQTLCVTPNIFGYNCPPVGYRMRELDSTYEPRWHGPWLGTQLDFRASDRLDFKLSAKYSWFDYKADANWNLRSDLEHPVSFRHTGDSRGWRLEAGANWNFTERHAISLTLNWDKQKLTNGTAKHYRANGTVIEQPLNDVNWDSWSGLVGYKFSF